jgi:hypothetical protein
VSGLDEDGVAARLAEDEIRDLPPVALEGIEEAAWVPDQAVP